MSLCIGNGFGKDVFDLEVKPPDLMEIYKLFSNYSKSGLESDNDLLMAEKPENHR